MHTAPHFILLKIVSVDGFIMMIVSGWSYWEMCLAHLHWTGPLSCCFLNKFLQYSESPLIISPTNVSKGSEFLIKFALDAANPPAFSPTFMKMFFIPFQQQELLNNLQTVQSALHPKIDLPPSTFSKIVDFIFDVLGECLVTDLKNRRFFYFSSIFGFTGSL